MKFFTHTKQNQKSRIFALLVSFLMVIFAAQGQRQLYFIGTGEWSDYTKWYTGVNCGAYPPSGTPLNDASELPTVDDDVHVCNPSTSVILTVDTDAFCKSLTLYSGNGSHELIVASNLTIAEDLIINDGNATAGVAVGDDATLIVGGNLEFNLGNNSNDFSLGVNAVVDIGGSFTTPRMSNNAFNIPMASGSSFSANDIDITLSGGGCAFTLETDAMVNVTNNFNFAASGGTISLELNAGAKVIVGGDFTSRNSNGQNNMPVSAGASVTVGGSFQIGAQNNNAALTVGGTVTVGGDFTANTGDTNRATINGSGTFAVAGNLTYGNGNNNGTWNTPALTLDMSGGCGQTIDISKTGGVTVGTFIQAEVCATPFTKSGTGNLTISSIYDQNCNASITPATNLAEGVSGIVYNSATIVHDICSPTIFITAPTPAELIDFTACYNEVSQVKTFQFYARALENNVTITAPAGYEISKDDVTYSASLTYAPENAYNDIATKTVYVRLKTGGTPGTTATGSIQLNTPNSVGGIKEIALTGAIATAELINPKTDIYVELPACVSENSAPSSFTVQGSCIPVNITVSAEFEISLTETTGYTQTLTNVAHGTTVYVRTKANVALGKIIGSIQFFDAYGTQPLLKEFAVFGKVQGPTVIFNKTAVRLGKTCVATPSDTSSFMVETLCSNSDVTIEIDAGFEVSRTAAGPYSTTITVPYAGDKKVYVRTGAGAAVGTNEGVIRATVDGNTTEIAVSGTVSGGEIIVKENPLYVGAYVVNTGPSRTKELSVEAVCLNTAAIALALDNTNFTLSALTLASPYTGTVNLRLAAGLPVGEYGANLTLTAKAADGTTNVETQITLKGNVIASGCAAIANPETSIRIEGVSLANPAGFKLNAKEYQIAQDDVIRIYAATPPACYTMVLEKQNLDINDNTWKPAYVPAEIAGAYTEFNFVPEEGALYRIRYVDNISGNDVFSTDLIVRIHYKCNCENEETVFLDDFGSFTGATTFVKDGSTYNNDFGGKMISDYAAPDPDNYVVNHYYRFDTNIEELKEAPNVWVPTPPYGINYQGDNDAERIANNLLGLNLEAWCGVKLTGTPAEYNFTRRVVDGTYALIANPEDFDCTNGDYWQGTDHSGTGAMLFVNIDKNGTNKVIYERDIDLPCTALQNGANIVFSAFINNAVQRYSPKDDAGTDASKGDAALQADLDNLNWVVNKAGLQYNGLPSPVNVRLDLIDRNSGAVIASISSGDIMVRSDSDGSQSWANLSYKFPVESSNYTIRITNNSAGGAGNDILIDDIEVTMCYPQIKLDISRTEESTEKIKLVCDTSATIPLIALPFDDVTVITDFIPDPYFLFQYRPSGGVWTDYGEILHFQDNIQLQLRASDPTFRGEVEWRVIAAERPDMFANILDGTLTVPTCDDLYAMSDTYIIRFMPNENKDQTLTGCIGDFKDFTMIVPKDFTGTAYTEWQLVNASDAVIYSSTTPHADWSVASNEVTFAAATRISSSTNPLKIGETAQTYTFKAIAPNAENCSYENTITYAAGGWCLEVDKSANKGEIDFEEEVEYTITITNTDTTDVTNIVINDVLPAGMEYNTVPSPPYTVVPNTTTFNQVTGDWNIGTLTPGQTATLVIFAKNTGGQGSEIVNTVWTKSRNGAVWNTPGEVCPSDLCDTDTVEVRSPVSVVLAIPAELCFGDLQTTVTATATREQDDVFDNITFVWDWGTLAGLISNKNTDSWTGTELTATESWDINTAGLAAGRYDIHVQVQDMDNANKIIAETDIQLVIHDLPAITVNNANICVGDAGGATLIADGAGSGGSYEWKKLDSGSPVTIPASENPSGVNTNRLTVHPANTTASPITYTYVVTGTDANTCSDTAQATVTVNPLPDMTIATTSSPICEGDDATIEFNFTVGEPDFTVEYWEGTAKVTKIVTTPPNPYTFVVTPSATIIYDIEKVTDANGCVATYNNTNKVEIEVTPKPSASITSTQNEMCYADGTYQLHSVTANGTVEWTMDPVWGSFDDATKNNPIYTPGTFAAAELSKDVKFTLTVDNAECPPVSKDFTLTIYDNPVAEINNAAGDKICVEDEYQLEAKSTAKGAALEWSHNGKGSWKGSNTIENPIYVSHADDSGETVTFTLTVSNGVCNDATATYELKVTPNSTATITSTITEMCYVDASSTYQLNSTTDNGDITWTWTPVTYGSLSATDIANPVFTPDDLPAAVLSQDVKFTLTVDNAECPPVSKEFTLTVHDAPEVAINNTAGDKICAGAEYQLTSTTKGAAVAWSHNGQGSWKGSNTIENPIYVSHEDDGGKTVTFTLTVSNGVCTDATADYQLQVVPSPEVEITTLDANNVICIEAGGVKNTFDLAATVTNVDNIQWTMNPAWGSFDDATSQTPVYTPGDFAVGEASPKSVLFTITGKNNECPDEDTDTYELIIHNTPTVTMDNTAADSKVCEAVAGTSEVQLKSTVANGSVTWTHNGSGTWKNGISNIDDPVYIVGTNDIYKTVTFTATVSNGVCADASDSFEVFISQNPNTEAQVTLEACIDDVHEYSVNIVPGSSWELVQTAGGAVLYSSATPNAAWSQSSNIITFVNDANDYFKTGTSGKTYTFKNTAAKAGDASVFCEYEQEVIIPAGGHCLVVDKSADNPEIEIGDQGVYTITVTNNDPLGNDVTNLVLSDKLPAEMTYISHAPATANYNAVSGDWIIGDLAFGATATLEITVKNVSLYGGEIINTTWVKERNTTVWNNPPCPSVLCDTSGIGVNSKLTVELLVDEICESEKAIGTDITARVICEEQLPDNPCTYTNINFDWTFPAGITETLKAGLTKPVTDSIYTIKPATYGNYTIEVKVLDASDGNKEITRDDVTFVVHQLPQITVNTNNTLTVCSGVDGLLTATGADVYTWAMKDGSPLQGLTPNATGDKATVNLSNPPVTQVIYTVTGKDNTTTCENTQDVTVTVNPLPTVALSINTGASNPICEGDATKLKFEFTGTPSFTITGTNIPNSPITGISQNPFILEVSPTQNTTYTVTSVSDNNCTHDVSADAIAVSINVTPKPEAKITNTPGGEICVAGANSTFPLQSATNHGTIMWSHDGAGSLSSNTSANPVYTPGPADAGKIITITLTVSNPDCPPVRDIYPLVCNQNPTANISLDAYCDNLFWTEDPITLSGNAGNGTPAYSHKWTVSAGTLTPSNTAANPTLKFASAQNNASIHYEVTDSKGCKATDTETIDVKALPKVEIGGDKPLCKGDDGNGVYYLETGYVFPVGTQYQWSTLVDGVETQRGTTTVPNIDILWGNTLTYRAQIKVVIVPPEYATECTPPIEVLTEEFGIYEKPFAIISGPLHACVNDVTEYTFINNGIQKDNTTYTWDLTNDLGLLTSNRDNSRATVEWTRAGTEQIELHMVNGVCTETATYIVEVHPLPQPDFSFQPSEKVYFQSENSYRYPDEIYPGKEVQFINETTPFLTPLSFQWDFAGDGVFTKNTGDVSEDVFFTYDHAGDYTAQLHVVDEQWGCRNTISKPIQVGENPNCGLTFPNAFTPAKASNNTFFAVYNEGVLEWGYELRIYDRWGTLLWSTTDKSAQWDGYYKGELARQDVYVYHCKATCEETDANGKHRELNIKGDVTVIR